MILHCNLMCRINFPPLHGMCSTILISGATKPVYAPEPFDVGRILQAEITYGDQTTSVTTAGPIDPGLF